MTDRISISSTDADLMQAFEVKRREGSGGEIGEINETPHQAAVSTGWKVIREIQSGTNWTGTAVLAQDLAGDLWVVSGPGPWAVRVTVS